MTWKVALQCKSQWWSEMNHGLIIERYVDEKLKESKRFKYESLQKNHAFVAEKLKFWTPQLCASQPKLFDFIITVSWPTDVCSRINPPPLSFFSLAWRWWNGKEDNKRERERDDNRLWWLGLVFFLVISKLRSACHSISFRFPWFLDSVRLRQIQGTPWQGHRDRCTHQLTWSIDMYGLPSCASSGL